jgi:ribonuclease PH
MQRKDGRLPDALRPVRITPEYLPHAEGSALIDVGDTRVLCTVSVEERLPQFLRGTGSGWVTAEYGMLPRSTSERMSRDQTRNSGRTHEIQRLIGRSLRAITDRNLLGERTLTVDCDVIRADGGTRTAAITGAYVALRQAVSKLLATGALAKQPLREAVAAVSVGIVKGIPLLDLCYEEDAAAEVDFNVVMTESGLLVEVQGTAEGQPFSRVKMDELLDLAERGVRELLEAQKQALAELGIT